jgi:transcriptional regulator with PAS, ATPase and Fis domain
MQVKLLRVLESGEVRRIGGKSIKYFNVRIIAASNADIEQKVQNGTFREDLYYRLNIIPFLIPPIRERPDDILLFANAFLHKYNKKYKRQTYFSADALQAMQCYQWPGNIREIRNVIERMVIISNSGQLEFEPSLSARFQAAEARHAPPLAKQDIKPLKEALRNYERSYLLRAYNACEQNVYQTAQLLDVHISGLYKKLADYRKITSGITLRK